MEIAVRSYGRPAQAGAATASSQTARTASGSEISPFRFEWAPVRGAGAHGITPSRWECPGGARAPVRVGNRARQALGEKRSRVAASAPRASRTIDTHRPDRWLPVASSAYPMM